MSEDGIVRYRPPPGGYKATEEEIARARAMTDEEIEAGALSDSDCPPLSEERLARFRRVPLAKSARWRSGLAFSSFARLFGFEEPTLEALERGQLEPEPETRRYLEMISADAERMIEQAQKLQDRTAA